MILGCGLFLLTNVDSRRSVWKLGCEYIVALSKEMRRVLRIETVE
ncbi:hypothetical protein ANAPC3_00719 [Anaplasma phagocytophilum]|nr:hypothetical protein ANAPC3_00719 [Anaplasma phagocytophilum]